jgi:hypothetical protein
MGAANSAQLVSVSAPMALVCSFVRFIASWMLRSRSTGSSMSVARDVRLGVTRFPIDVFSSSDRTETGTIATSGPSSGSSRSSK